MRNPMARLAGLLGCTEGQAYTLVIGIVLTVATVWAGVPPTLVDRAEGRFPLAAPAPVAPMVEPIAEPRLPLAPVPLRVSPTARDVAMPRAPTSVVASPAPLAPGSMATRLGNARIAASVGQPGAPEGVGVLADRRVTVATNNGGTRGANAPSEVVRFSPEGVRERAVTIEGQSPARTSGLGGLVIDGARNVFVTDTAGARIVRVDVSGRQDTYVELPDIGACAALISADACEQGAADDRPAPRGVAIDRDGALLVADPGQAVVWRIGLNGKPTLWQSFPETDSPVAVAFEGSGTALVLVSRSLDVSRAGRGVLHRFAMRPDGSPGTSTVVIETDVLSEPSGVAVGAMGEIVMALTRDNAIVLLTADGKLRDRLEAAEIESHTGVPLDGPAGVAVFGSSAWVANGSPRSNTEAHWVVFEVPLTCSCAVVRE